MLVAVNKDVTISNNSGVEVVALDAFAASSGSGSTPVAQQMYEQTLTALATTGGARTIAAGATATVALDGTYVDDAGATQYRTLYDLIFARPADLFPVAVTSEMLGLVDPVYPPITIAAADQTKHILALKFLINLMAYPTSNLAASYQAALSSAQQNPAKPGDIDNAMAAFFAGTKQYQSLTIDAVTAVTTYINTFAFLWAGASSDFTSFNQSATYYLYKPGAAASGSSSAPPNLVGKLSLQKDPNAPSPARVSDTSGGYTCTFTDPSGATSPLFYQAGQFVSDPKTDTPGIALKGSYVLKSQLTNDQSDAALVPVITGQVRGVGVLGTTTEQTAASHGSQFAAFFHPTTLGGWINLFASMLGLLMALDFLGKTAFALGKGIKSLWNKYQGHEPPPSEIEQLRAEVGGLREQIRQNQQDLLDRLDGSRQSRVPDEDFSDVESEVEVRIVDNRRIARRDVLEDAMNEQVGQVERLAGYGVDPKLEQVASNIRNDTQALRQAPDAASLDSALDQASANVNANARDLDALTLNAESRLSAQARAELDASHDAVSRLQEEEDVVDDQQSDAEDGGGGDDEISIGEDA